MARPRSSLVPFLAMLTALGSCTHLNTPIRETALARHEFTQPQMGVAFRIVLYAPSASKAEGAAAAAFNRIKELNAIMSDYETESELSRLSRTAGQGAEAPLSPDLWTILERSQALARRTGGAFDVTVGPCVNLWRRARRVRELPDPKRLAEARKAVGYRNLQLNPRTRTARLLVPGMRLDLGGIAKGYAVDEALKVLRAQGIERALVAGDGDIGVGEPPPGRPGWRIGIATLDVPNAPTNRYVLLKHAAISTSGDLSQRLEIGGVRYSHLVDPHTGVGVTDHSLVTVIARDSTTADSLATAVSVLGPEKGLKLIDRTPGAAARIVRSPEERLETYESKPFQSFLDPD
ncbi:MAG: FAD:protein FMN transferase [Verrucomicrobia bacterium]|nr:FAD:protein FMN transferase [Verrucomicrobiota bacterium]